MSSRHDLSRPYRGALAAMALSLVLASCSTFPSEKVSLDMTEIGAPVMLTKVSAKAGPKAYDFQSGFSSLSITTTSQSGGKTVSTTMTSGQTLNRPLDAQVSMGFVQLPSWFAITSLRLYTYNWDAIFASKKENRIDMSIALPAARE